MPPPPLCVRKSTQLSFFLHPLYGGGGDARLSRILHETVVVRVGGGSGGDGDDVTTGREGGGGIPCFFALFFGLHCSLTDVAVG